MTKHIINLVALVAIWAIIMFCFGCKTRKVDLQTSHVVKEASTSDKTSFKTVDSTKSIDNTNVAEHTSTGLKTASVDSTELQADSIIITTQLNGEKKVIIFPTRGKRLVHYSNSTLDQTIDNTVNTAYAKSVTNVSTLDSSVNKKSLTKSDSSGKAKVTSAVGSGSVWAKNIVWGVVIVLLFISGLLYLRLRK